MSRDVSVAGEEGDGGDSSDVEWCDGADPSDIGSFGWCKGTDTDTGSGEGIVPSDAEKWCKDLNASDEEEVSAGAKSDPVSCGDDGIPGPEVPEVEGA